MIDLGFEQSKHILQLVLKKKNRELDVLNAKVVHDLEAAGESEHAKKVMITLDQKFKFGTVSH